MPVKPRLGARAWALIVPAGLVVVALLVGILLTLTSVRGQIVEQNQRTRLLIQKADPTLQRAPGVLDEASPLLRDAAPVLDASRKAIPQARKAARDGQALLDATRPVVSDLAPVVASLPALLADLGPAAKGLQPLLADLGPAAKDLRPLAADLRPVVAALQTADLPRVLGDVQRLAAAGDRALPALIGLATEVRDRELLRRASRTLPIVGRLAEINRASLETQRETLTRTTSIEGLFRESLDIQRRILTRVESIDRKFPGPTADARGTAPATG